MRSKLRFSYCLLASSLLSGCVAFRSTEGYVQASGRDLVVEGERIVLKGVNAGGLFVTENWMSPNKIARSQSETYEAIEKRFGTAKADELYDVARDAWWTEKDFKDIADIGFNVIRLPLEWRSLMSEDGTINEKGFARVDWFVAQAATNGLYTILDLHGAPGSQNGRDHSGDTRQALTFHDQTWLDRSCALWRALATRYRDNRWVAAYDLVNEPEGQVNGLSSATNVIEGINALYQAVRAVDDRHLIMIGACWDPCHLPPPSKYGWTNVCYEYHFYAWGDEKDADKVLANLEMHRDREHQDGHGVPVYVGEFTFFVTEAWDRCLDLMDREGWSWSLWTYKNVSRSYNWGLLQGPGHSPEVDALATDDFETIRAKWAAPAKPGFFTVNQPIIDILKRRIHTVNK